MAMPEAHLQGVGGGIHLGQDNLVVGGVVGAKRITAAVGISAGTISAHGIAGTTGRIWNSFPATGYVDITCTVLEIHRERDSLSTAGGPCVDAHSVTVLTAAAIGLHLETIGGVGGQAGDGDTRSSEAIKLCSRYYVVFSVGDDIGSTVVVVSPSQRDAAGGDILRGSGKVGDRHTRRHLFNFDIVNAATILAAVVPAEHQTGGGGRHFVKIGRRGLRHSSNTIIAHNRSESVHVDIPVSDVAESQRAVAGVLLLIPE